jgi:membrane associated rhomboid family serine protease
MATCYRHPGRETGVSCSNCGNPICPDCMTVTSVGMRCPECGRQSTKVRTIRSTANRGYEVTKVLIAINVIVFFAEGSGVYTLTGSTGSSWLLNHGFLFAPLIRYSHDYWRLVTSGFLHLDILHVASNMYVLYWVGRLLEPAIGRQRFIAIYFTGLLAGSLGVFIVSPLSQTAGASGAIFGLMGAAFTEAHRRGVDQVRNQLVILIVVNLVITLSVPGISIGAHLGGLIGGGLATLGFQQGDRLRSPALGYAACLALAVIAVVGAIILADHTGLPGVP